MSSSPTVIKIKPPTTTSTSIVVGTGAVKSVPVITGGTTV